MNKVMLLGNLGRDPELRKSGNGTSICNLSVATSERKKNSSGSYEGVTTWHNVVTFGNVADNCGKYLSKGSKCLVEGRIENGSYEKDGSTRYYSKVIAQNVQFLSASGETGGYQPPAIDHSESYKYESRTQTEMTFEDDDIPF